MKRTLSHSMRPMRDRTLALRRESSWWSWWPRPRLGMRFPEINNVNRRRMIKAAHKKNGIPLGCVLSMCPTSVSFKKLLSCVHTRQRPQGPSLESQAQVFALRLSPRSERAGKASPRTSSGACSACTNASAGEQTGCENLHEESHFRFSRLWSSLLG